MTLIFQQFLLKKVVMPGAPRGGEVLFF